MRLIPILAAASIGLLATAATAQNMNTNDPNSAPNRANTADPNSAPGASQTGGKPSRNVNRASTMDPNSAPTTTGKAMSKSKKHARKKHRM